MRYRIVTECVAMILAIFLVGSALEFVMGGVPPIPTAIAMALWCVLCCKIGSLLSGRHMALWYR